MQRELVQSVAILLTNAGINILQENNTGNIGRFVIPFAMTFLAGLSTSGFCLTNTADFIAFAQPSPYIAHATNILSSTYLLFHYKNIIGQMLFEMDQNCYTYPDEHLLRYEYPWYLKEANVMFMMQILKYVMVSCVVMVALPVFGQLAYYGRITTFMYPSWTPWKVDSLRIELLMFGFQFLQACCCAWSCYILSIFLLFILIEFTRQYRRLIAAVSSLEHRTLQQDVRVTHFDRVLRKNIIHCVRHHQILHKNFQLFKIWFSMFFSINLAVSVVTFGLVLYIMINAPSLGPVLIYFTVVLLIWITLLITCLISEIFSSLDDQLAEALIWEAPWYKVNKENRTLLLLYHSTACQPLRLYGLSIFEATRVTFGKLIRTTYSFFNVLNLSLKPQ